jgi:hypothetical protein
MPSRRAFLGSLLAAAALDPERLLWVPGAKLISIPGPPQLDTWDEFVALDLPDSRIIWVAGHASFYKPGDHVRYRGTTCLVTAAKANGSMLRLSTDPNYFDHDLITTYWKARRSLA